MAIEFDGINDFISFGANANALESLFSSNATVAFWTQTYKTGDTFTNAPRFLQKGGEWFINNSTVDNTWGLIMGRATVNSIFNAGSAPSLNTWYHLAITYNNASTATQPEFYLNGDTILSTETAGSGGAANNSTANEFTMGGDTAVATTMNGMMEDLRVYNSFLTQPQIRTLAAGYRGPLGGEILWVSGDDASGMTAWDGQTLSGTNILPDKSITVQTGTPTNSPLGRASNAPRVPTWGLFSLIRSGVDYTLSLTGTMSAAQIVGTISKATTKALTGAISAAQMVGTIVSKFIFLLKAFIGLDTTPTLDVILDTTPTLSVSLDTTPTVDVEFGRAPTQP